MIQTINPYLTFDGDAAKAIELYTQALGAKVESIMHWRDMPGGDLSPEVGAMVMYAKLEIGGGVIEMSDTGPDHKVNFGNDTIVAVGCDDPKELDRMFEALAKGGTIEMPLENTFWNARYGRLQDRFGIRWSFNCQLEG